ncbi:hypothetical protein [Ottowia thiooxydans]|uniref:Uncharacterized protein n=1 Tax=Ottowia thiooxydans TaxID=219182 RepID=A0ABV2Q8K4_9BURK
MPKPYVFESRETLIERLRSPGLAEISRQFFAVRCPSMMEVVRTGVSGNTFRAFRHVPTPSKKFRTWTTCRLEHTLRDILACERPDSYALQVHMATQALESSWRHHANKEMGYGRGAKLLNLVLKKLACLESLTDEQRTRLISLMHVPWDSYTIQGLRLVSPALSIPSNATMKFITTPEQYQVFMAEITDITAEANVPAIYYDVLAWDMAH